MRRAPDQARLTAKECFFVFCREAFAHEEIDKEANALLQRLQGFLGLPNGKARQIALAAMAASEQVEGRAQGALRPQRVYSAAWAKARRRDGRIAPKDRSVLAELAGMLDISSFETSVLKEPGHKNRVRWQSSATRYRRSCTGRDLVYGQFVKGAAVAVAAGAVMITNAILALLGVGSFSWLPLPLLLVGAAVALRAQLVFSFGENTTAPLDRLLESVRVLRVGTPAVVAATLCAMAGFIAFFSTSGS